MGIFSNRMESYLSTFPLSSAKSPTSPFSLVSGQLAHRQSHISHIIDPPTPALAAIISSETSLSFSGIGLRPQAIVRGVLAQRTQNVHTGAISPWPMLLTLPAIVAVLARLAWVMAYALRLTCTAIRIDV